MFEQMLFWNYEWIKAFHLIAVIAWMAGLLYLPRLFVYHASLAVGSESSDLFKVMEFRLLRYIMNPALIMVWFLGLVLIFMMPDWLQQSWMHVKLTALIGMSWFHVWLARCCRDFAFDANKHSQNLYRITNEIPTILLIIIVIMVVVKPF